MAMIARNVFFKNGKAALFLLPICALLASQVNASLLDPTLIGRELQKFARDGLGVDEMQVKAKSFPWVLLATSYFCLGKLSMALLKIRLHM